MGFETQEEAERWAENIEFLADQKREEEMLRPKHLQDAPRVARNTFWAELDGKVVEVVFASFAACLEREANALRDRTPV